MSADEVMDFYPEPDEDEIREHMTALVKADAVATPEIVEPGREPASVVNASPSSIAVDPYVGVAALPFDAKAQEVLARYQDVPDDWIDIKPDGQIYLSHMKARRVLNEAFGFGGWAIVPVGDFRKEQQGDHIILYRTYRMYVGGRYIGEVESAGDYWSNNAEQNYADAAESCQSYALNRLCKNFGLASQCWDKQYGERWKKQHAHRETRETKRGPKQVWVKNDIQVSGAGSAGLPEPHRLSSDASPSSLTPTAERDLRSSPTTSGPATGKSTAIVRLKEKGKEWRFQGTPNAMFKDESGRSLKFVGKEAIDIADMACGSPDRVWIEYKLEDAPKGQIRVVLDARIARDDE